MRKNSPKEIATDLAEVLDIDMELPTIDIDLSLDSIDTKLDTILADIDTVLERKWGVSDCDPKRKGAIK